MFRNGDQETLPNLLAGDPLTSHLPKQTRMAHEKSTNLAATVEK